MYQLRDVPLAVTLGKYRETWFEWLPAWILVQSQEFSDDFVWYNFIDYLHLWADKLNKQEGTDQYVVARKTYGSGNVEITLVILEDEDEPEESYRDTENSTECLYQEDEAQGLNIQKTM